MSFPNIGRHGGWQVKDNALLRLLFIDNLDELYQTLTQSSWWLTSLLIGFLFAFLRLLYLLNPSVRYGIAVHNVRGLEITLPEAMAVIEAWGWYGLIIIPLLLSGLFYLLAVIFKGISRRICEDIPTGVFMGTILAVAFIFWCGQVVGYLLVLTGGLESLMDLRDLTPGVGLGLLPFFSLERIGPFFKEMVRGFDLFGIWMILRGSKLYQSFHRVSKQQAMTSMVSLYATFLVLRWVLEGPGYQLWQFFWSAGSGTI